MVSVHYITVFVAFICLCFANTGYGSDSKVECVNRIVNWCKNTSFRNSGSSITTTTDLDSKGKSVHVYCIFTSEGKNCSRNNNIWFSCFPSHKLTYKGKELHKDSTDGADDEICYTSKKISDKGYEFNNKAFEEGQKRFQKSMEDMHKSFKRIFRDCFPFCNVRPFGIGYHYY